MPPLTCGVLLLAIYMSFLHHAAVADQCSGGSNIFTEILENSPYGTLISHLAVFGDLEGDAVHLTLSGMDAEWFYLDGKTVRLNVSEEKVLDREVLETPVLMVSFTCTEDGFSPLAAVHSVVFRTQAKDADGDTLMYVIDSASADARYFRIDLPNSGKIVYALRETPGPRELGGQLQLVRLLGKRAQGCTSMAPISPSAQLNEPPPASPDRLQIGLCHEMNTKERYNSSARIQVNVMDGDDQYPQFLPCNFLSHDGVSVCVNPIYTTNITEGEIKASQVNDAKKYAVTEVRVRILAANSHPPQFGMAQYQAFVHEEELMASLVVTYSGQTLFLNAIDVDFADGFNPMVRYSLKHQSNHTQLFQIMPDGLLIARADHLHAFERYTLQIIARDEESGETTNATVNVEVLRPGEEVPLDPLEAGHQGTMDAGILAGSLGALLLVTAIVLFLILRAMKRRQRHQQNMERAALAMEKHPNVNAGKAIPNPGNVYFQNEGYSDLGDEAPKFYGGQTLNAKQASVRSEKDVATRDILMANSVGRFDNQQGGQTKVNLTSKEQEEGTKAALLNGKTLEQPSSTTPCLEDKSLSKDSQMGEALVEVQPSDEVLVEVQAVEEDKEVLFPDTSGGNEETKTENASGESQETSPLQSQLLWEEKEEQPLQEGKMEANGDTSPRGPISESPSADSNCVDSEGVEEHADPPKGVNGSANPSQASSDMADVTTAQTTEVNDAPPAPQKQPGTPMPTLKVLPKEVLEEEEDDDDGEETPKATSPTYQDPLASLPISDVRMPVTLLQLLEDSIEC
ncbi:hypothetical protein JD844_029084 [Phrynosoma platyrhinos]|uniref:Cadherin domain-containing protein n=1 Tax=Phrynosoma platyrhinos TaxID=52577 RepID=A0ABQ7SIS6_PHRPL|nr:hypothetical protein JD844_029084 [Phrynosoma platyrhinos]